MDEHGHDEDNRTCKKAGLFFFWGWLSPNLYSTTHKPLIAFSMLSAFFFFLHCGSPTHCVHFIAEVVRSLTFCVQLNFRRKAFFQFASQAVEQVQLTLNPKSICLWVARGGFTAHPRTSTLVKSREGGWRYANSERP